MGIGIVLTVNLIASLLFLFYNRREGLRAFLIFMLFLAVPVLGILMYELPPLFFRLLHKKNVYNAEDLIYAGEDEVYAERPDMEQELNVIPVKEALVVNESGEKRKFVLDIIKEDMAGSYRTILPALKDTDSETSHYAAAAAMEMQRRLRRKIDGLSAELSEGKAVEKELLDALVSYVDSGVLTQKDLRVTRHHFITVMKQGLFKSPDQFDNGYFLTLSQYLVEEGEYGEAVEIINERINKEPGEKLFEKLLEIYYLTGDEKAFRDTIERVRGSGIILSPEALSRLRFWMNREGMS